MARQGWNASSSWKQVIVCSLCLLLGLAQGRPLVRNIRSTHEFDRLLQKHATETGLPVVVDFYSDSCGPCRMMAPIFKKVAGRYKDQAVFCKIDTNAQYELSARYQIRSLPTFTLFLGGKKLREEKGGIGEARLDQITRELVNMAQADNVQLTLEDLKHYYATVDAAKAEADIASVHKKCVDMTLKNNPHKECVGPAANQLARRLNKKYGSKPKLQPRFDPVGSTSSQSETTKKSSSSQSKKSSGKGLHLATKEELMEELEKRLDEERDQQVEEESEDEDEAWAAGQLHGWQKGAFPERLVIIGGGPAGMAAAIYAARAGLTPLVVAPLMGGQLQGKGVDVENYPGLFNVTGPAVVSAMRTQASYFGAVFEDDVVNHIDASTRPLKVITNNTGVIDTHSIVVATGAESNWLGIPGEWELRGGGVSSCATCDGFLFSGKDVVVVGGGDAAMEDALVLARTSKSVTVIHRRDAFRASKVLADRVLNHPSITVRWNTVVTQVLGKQVASEAPDTEQVDLDDQETTKVVSGIRMRDVVTNEESTMDCDAFFVAIGHTPSTSFLEGVVEFDPEHTGYVLTLDGSTRTSVPGIFAAGDVADPIYRQAVTSAGSGAAAALDAERWLSEEGLGNEAADLEAELLADIMGGGGAGGMDYYNAYEEAGGRGQGIKESIAGEL